MASPWDIDRGDHVVVTFKTFPKAQGPQGPIWDPLHGAFRQWITRKGETEKVGLVVRVKWNLPDGLSDIDQRISLDDVLMLGVVSNVALVAGRTAPLPKGLLADDGSPLQ